MIGAIRTARPIAWCDMVRFLALCALARFTDPAVDKAVAVPAGERHSTLELDTAKSKNAGRSKRLRILTWYPDEHEIGPRPMVIGARSDPVSVSRASATGGRRSSTATLWPLSQIHDPGRAVG